MIKAWERFEADCCDYLANEYGDKADFIQQGGSDSVHSDILCKPFSTDSEPFYIEVKSPEAQCGQFVLKADSSNQIFIYSSKNKHKLNAYSKYIIRYMDQNYARYSQVRSGSIDLDIPEEIMIGWIQTAYRDKDAAFFMSYANDGYIIVPLDNLHDAFSFSACYRVKKSGSHSLSKTAFNNIYTDIHQLLRPQKTEYVDGKHVMLTLDEPAADPYITIKRKHYYLSRKEGTLYELRALSSVCNANVIFSIRAKEDYQNQHLQEFIDRLN